QSANVFLFPSHEGAGMVVPEAMSFGLPVLAFDNAGPGELIGNNLAIISDLSYEDAINDFSIKLMRLRIDNQFNNYLAERAQNRQRTKLTWQNKAQKINTIYTSVIPKKTIAVFHPSTELYGADRILAYALESLDESIVKRVYLPSNGPLVDYLSARVKGIEIIIDSEIPIIYRSLFKPKGLLLFIKRWWSFKKKMKNDVRIHGISTVYLNTLACSFLLPLFKRRKVKTFIHVHEIIESPRIIAKITSYLSYKYADQVVCVSKAVENNLLKLTPRMKEKCSVIHNGIVGKTVVSAQVLNKKKFVLFGRLMPKKGQWYLIEALQLLPNELLNNCEFIFAGDVLKGNEALKIDLLSKIEKAGLTNKIKLMGFVNDIDSLLASADVCLIPSLMKDPFPTTVLEAMSAGKPIIATNHGGAVEAIRDGISGCL
ncbi:MAG: glycosyltransferase, partial [Crocinitomicaceae bacterium]